MMAACNAKEMSYCCEICGVEGLSEEELRVHTNVAHVGGDGICPFCELRTRSSSELVLHVNQAHLDYLTPEMEVNNSIGFIDDVSPSDYMNRMATNGDDASDWSLPSLSSQSGRNKGASGKGGSNINNINLCSKMTNGDLSPNNSSHGEGSPFRSSLNLKLKEKATLWCPMCEYKSVSPSELEEHINRQHFDLTSPSIGGGASQVFACPLCNKAFDSPPDLELHVNIEHRDVLSPASPTATACPVCGVVLDNESDGEQAKHVESHFPATASSPPPPAHMDRAASKEREQREFELLRAQYGMDNQGNFREQYVTNMQRAVYAGEMTVSDYYERTLDLKAAESCGIDDGTSVTRNLVPRVRALSVTSTNVIRTLTCTCVDHFASSYGDRGWGCGYRNAQMMFSSMLSHTGYNERLYQIWRGAKPPRSAVPSISRLQSLIEEAWSQGFDVQGAEQLGCRLVNTRKWIGATEVMTLLAFLRIRCQLVDFHRPTGAGGAHPELFNWVLKYFENAGGSDFVAPLYLQHQGHSRTIMGVEVQRDGNLVLLVLDPSHSPPQMAQLGDTNVGMNSMRLLRKSESAMKARQYQIVAAIGTIDTEQQYQQSKVLRGLRFPQDG